VVVQVSERDNCCCIFRVSSDETRTARTSGVRDAHISAIDLGTASESGASSLSSAWRSLCEKELYKTLFESFGSSIDQSTVYLSHWGGIAIKRTERTYIGTDPFDLFSGTPLELTPERRAGPR
jgi:hypothetical protein